MKSQSGFTMCYHYNYICKYEKNVLRKIKSDISIDWIMDWSHHLIGKCSNVTFAIVAISCDFTSYLVDHEIVDIWIQQNNEERLFCESFHTNPKTIKHPVPECIVSLLPLWEKRKDSTIFARDLEQSMKKVGPGNLAAFRKMFRASCDEFNMKVEPLHSGKDLSKIQAFSVSYLLVQFLATFYYRLVASDCATLPKLLFSVSSRFVIMYQNLWPHFSTWFFKKNAYGLEIGSIITYFRIWLEGNKIHQESNALNNKELEIIRSLSLTDTNKGFRSLQHAHC